MNTHKLLMKDDTENPYFNAFIFYRRLFAFNDQKKLIAFSITSIYLMCLIAIAGRHVIITRNLGDKSFNCFYILTLLLTHILSLS